ncbi:MAG: hypothetical protein OXI18_12385 [bacterium]|nr:hypothetical protein [bacterium]
MSTFVADALAPIVEVQEVDLPTDDIARYGMAHGKIPQVVEQCDIVADNEGMLTVCGERCGPRSEYHALARAGRSLDSPISGQRPLVRKSELVRVKRKRSALFLTEERCTGPGFLDKWQA